MSWRDEVVNELDRQRRVLFGSILEGLGVEIPVPTRRLRDVWNLDDDGNSTSVQRSTYTTESLIAEGTGEDADIPEAEKRRAEVDGAEGVSSSRPELDGNTLELCRRENVRTEVVSVAGLEPERSGRVDGVVGGLPQTETTLPPSAVRHEIGDSRKDTAAGVGELMPRLAVSIPRVEPNADIERGSYLGQEQEAVLRVPETRRAQPSKSKAICAQKAPQAAKKEPQILGNDVAALQSAQDGLGGEIHGLERNENRHSEGSTLDHVPGKRRRSWFESILENDDSGRLTKSSRASPLEGDLEKSEPPSISRNGSLANEPGTHLERPHEHEDGPDRYRKATSRYKAEPEALPVHGDDRLRRVASPDEVTGQKRDERQTFNVSEHPGRDSRLEPVRAVRDSRPASRDDGDESGEANQLRCPGPVDSLPLEKKWHCQFHSGGRCRNGDACRSGHDLEEDRDGRQRNRSSRRGYESESAGLPISGNSRSVTRDEYDESRETGRHVKARRCRRSRSADSLPSERKQPCTFYSRGKCHNGDNCRFSHVVSEDSPGPGGTPQVDEPCRFHKRGLCRNGNACRYDHSLEVRDGRLKDTENFFQIREKHGKDKVTNCESKYGRLDTISRQLSLSCPSVERDDDSSCPMRRREEANRNQRPEKAALAQKGSGDRSLSPRRLEVSNSLRRPKKEVLLQKGSRDLASDGEGHSVAQRVSVDRGTMNRLQDKTSALVERELGPTNDVDLFVRRRLRPLAGDSAQVGDTMNISARTSNSGNAGLTKLTRTEPSVEVAPVTETEATSLRGESERSRETLEKESPVGHDLVMNEDRSKDQSPSARRGRSDFQSIGRPTLGRDVAESQRVTSPMLDNRTQPEARSDRWEATDPSTSLRRQEHEHAIVGGEARTGSNSNMDVAEVLAHDRRIDQDQDEAQTDHGRAPRNNREECDRGPPVPKPMPQLSRQDSDNGLQGERLERTAALAETENLTNDPQSRRNKRSLKVCKHYRKGKCRYGERCFKSHDRDAVHRNSSTKACKKKHRLVDSVSPSTELPGSRGEEVISLRTQVGDPVPESLTSKKIVETDETELARDEHARVYSPLSKLEQPPEKKDQITCTHVSLGRCRFGEKCYRVHAEPHAVLIPDAEERARPLQVGSLVESRESQPSVVEGSGLSPTPSNLKRNERPPSEPGQDARSIEPKEPASSQNTEKSMPVSSRLAGNRTFSESQERQEQDRRSPVGIPASLLPRPESEVPLRRTENAARAISSHEPQAELRDERATEERERRVDLKVGPLTTSGVLSHPREWPVAEETIRIGQDHRSAAKKDTDAAVKDTDAAVGHDRDPTADGTVRGPTREPILDEPSLELTAAFHWNLKAAIRAGDGKLCIEYPMSAS